MFRHILAFIFFPELVDFQCSGIAKTIRSTYRPFWQCAINPWVFSWPARLSVVSFRWASSKLHHCSLYMKQQQFALSSAWLIAHKVLETTHSLAWTMTTSVMPFPSLTHAWILSLITKTNWLVWWQMIIYYLQDSQIIHLGYAPCKLWGMKYIPLEL